MKTLSVIFLVVLLIASVIIGAFIVAELLVEIDRENKRRKL